MSDHSGNAEALVSAGHLRVELSKLLHVVQSYLVPFLSVVSRTSFAIRARISPRRFQSITYGRSKQDRRHVVLVLQCCVATER